MQRRCPSQRTTKGSVTAQNHHGWLRECPWRNSSWSPHSIGDADAIKRALVHLFFTYGFCVTTSSGSWQSFKSFLKPHSVVLDNTFRAVSFTQWDAGVGEALLLPMSRGRDLQGSLYDSPSVVLPIHGRDGWRCSFLIPGLPSATYILKGTGTDWQS